MLKRKLSFLFLIVFLLLSPVYSVVANNMDNSNRYEAEDAILDGGAGTQDSGHASGGKYVNDIGSVEFSNVNVLADGRYVIEISYASDNVGAQWALDVNEDRLLGGVSIPSTGGWGFMGNFESIIVELDLVEGVNTLRFENQNNSADLDYIEVLGKVEDQRYEAEVANLQGNGTVANIVNASGGQYVENINNDESIVEFSNVNVATAGSYTIEISYANGGEAAQWALVVNGEVYSEGVFLPATADWNVFNTIELELELHEGDNVLAFTFDENYANLDYIKVLGNDSEGTENETQEDTTNTNEEDKVTETRDIFVRYEAEADQLSGAAWIGESDEASNGKFVGGIDKKYEDSLEFKNVYVDADGSYFLKVSYATPMDNASLALLINGEETVVTTPATADWGIFNTKLIAVDLKGGDNSLMFTAHEGFVQIDYIEVLGEGGEEDTTNINEESTKTEEDTTNTNEEDKVTETRDIFVRYEAEADQLSGAAWIGESDEASNGKFVGGIDKKYEDSLEFKNVYVDADGSYFLKVSYATPMDNASLALLINGEETVVTTPATADWGIFNTKLIAVDLKGGDNSLMFTAHEGFVQIDYIEVLGEDGEEDLDAFVDTDTNEESTETEEDTTDTNEESTKTEEDTTNTNDEDKVTETRDILVRYEAEADQLSGAAWIGESDEASNGKFVGGIDKKYEDSLEFKNVYVDADGSYFLKVSYATPMDNASLALLINGEETVVTTPATADWGIFNTKLIAVDLKGGDNSLMFTAHEGFVQIDYIEVLGEGGEEDLDAYVENPKTGDKGIILYSLLAFLSIGGFSVLFTVKKRAATNY